MEKSTDERLARLEKLKEIRGQKVNPYPASAKRNQTVVQVLENFDKFSANKKMLSLAGRLKSIRLHGGSAFANLEDGSGAIQLFFREDHFGAKPYKFFKELIDLGDFVRVKGILFTTKTGEKTLEVEALKLLTKTLAPLPEKWHGLSDVEIRYRQRYLDLIANPSVREIFKKRSLIIKTIREFFERDGFMEVETPILQPIPGGATARPFITHHNALDIDLYLRIAPELYLKRLIVGGFERVFEIARCFRNEGIDWSHNPEFTQIELYRAYADYNDLIKMMEKFFVYLMKKTNGGEMKVVYEKDTIDFTPPYPRITFRDILMKFGNCDIEKYPDRESMAKKARELGLDVLPSDDRGKIMDEIFKKVVRPKIVNPIFVINHPIELSPLAKKVPGDSRYVERFQLLVAGTELVNAFSELNDPIDQRERFAAQQKMREAGDAEAMRIDEDFITALMHGMPPTAGLGMGIDRLTALLTNSHNIKEVILFPTLKPENK
ncbi:lysine--tRNA ligase [Patescibacteria group bacterium]|nr:lysine--tRNA ligase [Patescibacteria group bacterium]